MIVGIAQVSLYYADLYDLRVASDRRELYTRLIQALASTSFALAVLYFWFPSLMVGRGVFLDRRGARDDDRRRLARCRSSG